MKPVASGVYSRRFADPFFSTWSTKLRGRLLPSEGTYLLRSEWDGLKLLTLHKSSRFIVYYYSANVIIVCYVVRNI